MQPGYPEFRRKLDAVLRRRDAAALRQFLIEEGQWEADTTTDAERAMWMMIATSPALGDLHDEAVRWLASHGYGEEAQVLGRPRTDGQPRRTPPSAPARRERRPRPHDQRHRGPRAPHPDR
jgi:hypothetical protein